MINHVTIQVNDVEKSKEFYEKAFAPLGWKVAFGENKVFYAFDIGKGFLFEIAKSQNSDPITSVHVAFRVSDQKKFRSFRGLPITASLGQDQITKKIITPRLFWTQMVTI